MPAGPSHHPRGLSHGPREVSLQNGRRRLGLLGCPGVFVLADIFLVHELWVLSKEMLRGQKSQSGDWTSKEGFQRATEVSSSFVTLPSHLLAPAGQEENNCRVEQLGPMLTPMLTLSVPDGPLGHGRSRGGEATFGAWGLGLWPPWLSAMDHCRRLALDIFLAGLLPPLPHCKLKNTFGHYKQLVTSFVRF